MKKIIVLLLLTMSIIHVSNAQKTKKCDVTNMIHVGTPWVDVINLSYSQTSVTFYTNFVCGATNYTWIIDGMYSNSTSSNSITLSAQDFLLFAWNQGGGCSVFNSKLTLPWPGSDYGIYNTTMSVRSDVTNLITIPVKIVGVRKCFTGSEKRNFSIGK
jgi:hypothetical protein